jgi:hypothetical protein
MIPICLNHHLAGMDIIPIQIFKVRMREMLRVHTMWHCVHTQNTMLMAPLDSLHPRLVLGRPMFEEQQMETQHSAALGSIWQEARSIQQS